jgi:glutathione S-transferase
MASHLRGNDDHLDPNCIDRALKVAALFDHAAIPSIVKPLTAAAMPATLCRMLLYDAPDPAPNPRRVRLFLSAKGISDVPMRTLSIVGREHKAEDFVTRYPPGQLPVLELDDGSMLGESLSICRYLESLYPDTVPLFGRTAAEAARIDMWCRRVEFTLMTPVGMVWMHCHPFTARVVVPQYGEFGESNRPKVAAAMQRFDAVLAEGAARGAAEGGPWLAGAAFSMADIALLTTLDFARFVGLAEPDNCAALEDWRGRVEARVR